MYNIFQKIKRTKLKYIKRCFALFLVYIVWGSLCSWSDDGGYQMPTLS